MLGRTSARPAAMACLLLLVFFSGIATADGVVVDKVYDPYVQPLETEIEWRFIDQDEGVAPALQKHFLGFGRSVSDRWAVEIYAIAQRNRGESLSIDAYEVEAKWQLTEQGEFAVDWGVLFELEREVQNNIWEASAHLLAVRDFGRSTVTANLGLIYEWGEPIENEIETNLRVQARYRLAEVFEPGLELHVGQDTTAVGPAFTGLFRVSQGRKLRWELGYFSGVSERSPDNILRANIEFEF